MNEAYTDREQENGPLHFVAKQRSKSIRIYIDGPI